jgi:transcriptional regulator of heat shock response
MNPVDELSDAVKDVLLEEVGNRLKIKQFEETFKSHNSNEISAEELKKSEENFEDLASVCRRILEKLKRGFPYDQIKLKSLTENIQKLKNYDGVLNKEAFYNIINCLNLQEQVFTVPQTGTFL